MSNKESLVDMVMDTLNSDELLDVEQYETVFRGLKKLSQLELTTLHLAIIRSQLRRGTNELD